MVAGSLGAAAPLAYLVCAALMALIVVCIASAGSRVSLTGGLYAYVEAAFGPFIGFLGGVLYLLSATFASASVASAFTASLAVLWPAAGTAAGRTLLLVGLFALLAFVNVRGAAPGARLIEAMTLAKLMPLILLIAAGVWFVEPQNLTIGTLPAPSALGRTAIVLIFAFVGLEVALVPSGEVSDPAKTVPRALFIALAITTTIYLLIQTVAQGLLGDSMSTFAAAPLAEATARVLGRAGRVLVVAGATVSMFGYLAGDLLGSPRAVYALARDGILPRALARVHPRFHTPHIAIPVYALVAAAIAVSGSFNELAVFANVAILSLYLMCVAASYELQRRDVRTGGTPFAAPGGVAIPMLAAIAIIWLLSQATARELLLDGAVLVVASALYLVRGTRFSLRAG
jgi:amino acid transporter